MTEHSNIIFELNQRDLSEEEVEFGRWIDDCMMNARIKFDLDWWLIAFQLNGKAQKAIIRAAYTPDAVK